MIGDVLALMLLPAGVAAVTLVPMLVAHHLESRRRRRGR